MSTRIVAGNIRLKRAYEPASPEDGARILVDRLWPRGVAKADAALDGWMKDIAPSAGLRQWFAHDPARWDEFRRRYAEELRAHCRALASSYKVPDHVELCAALPVTETGKLFRRALRDMAESLVSAGSQQIKA